jgi:hypothetical protein
MSSSRSRITRRSRDGVRNLADSCSELLHDQFVRRGDGARPPFAAGLAAITPMLAVSEAAAHSVVRSARHGRALIDVVRSREAQWTQPRRAILQARSRVLPRHGQNESGVELPSPVSGNHPTRAKRLRTVRPHHGPSIHSIVQGFRFLCYLQRSSAWMCYCCNGSSRTTVDAKFAVLSVVAGSGPRPCVNARSSTLRPWSKPGRP